MVAFIQETKIGDREDLKAASDKAYQAGWKMAGGLALTTDKGAASSGTAVMVRKHLEVGEVRQATGVGESFTVVAGRATACWVNTWVKGGFIAVSMYLKDTVGLDDDNWQVLIRVGELLAHLGLPFIIGGDFNVGPQALVDSGWIRRIKGQLAVPAEGTCKGKDGYSTIDYFVVSLGLDKALRGVRCDPDEPAKPHRPVTMKVEGRPRSITEMVLHAPRRFPAAVPIG